MKHPMRIALTSLIALSIFGSHDASEAQQAQGSAYQAMSDKFFSMLQQDEVASAVDYLFDTNPNLKKMPEGDNLKQQFVSLTSTVGPDMSHTILIDAKVSDGFVFQHYFVAYERQPVSVRIKYYKPGVRWVCYGLQFDVDLAEKIQKAADEKLPIEVK